ncbi:alcohol dehydrogenase II [Luminiphilus syltensis NOR5-1B]|uniref:Alcohol dehydrogenase II n=1 Tax=Luminiphilus syltensis NOR5-1B TaxID=565045 RepID=B8KS17_9GAMM|nr:iron-containing alcohol dehydrogenase [Luminiphilus syltensis]EED36235.1 alcohol dehydrogenase II [Luminiphilus syltensis NOR5-1B]
MTDYLFQTVSTIAVGTDRVLTLDGFCKQLGVSRPLLVTDSGLVGLGLIDPPAAALAAAGLEATVFDEVEADPSEAVVERALARLRQADCDGVIAVGGGSSMDTAKVVAALAVADQPLSEMYGVDQIAGARLPLILVPTTAGTGSEATPVAVITTGDTTKAGISDATLLPDVAVLDAALTTGLPPAVTAMTGIDAMVHAIEAFTSIHRKNPISDALALEAMKLLTHNLLTVLDEPHNLAARESMLLGSLFAGQAFANAPVAAVHALAYPLGGHFHIPHGLSNSLMLPSVLSFNASAAGQHYAALTACLPGSVPATAEGLIAWLEEMIAASGLPRSLEAAGVPLSAIPTLAADAMTQQRLLVNNPVPVSESDAVRLYEKAWEGLR